VKPVYVEARDIDDAWWQLLRRCFEHGYEYTVGHGSYEGQKRYELDFVTVYIKEPWKQIVPLMPEGCSVPPPASMEQIEQYFVDYLTTDDKSPKEDYRYGERLVAPKLRGVRRDDLDKPHTYEALPIEVPELFWRAGRVRLYSSVPIPMGGSQIDEAIRILRHSNETNQACMEIAMPNDIYLTDPPCLRVVDCRVRYGKLHFMVYFRCISGDQTAFYRDTDGYHVGTAAGLFASWEQGKHPEVLSVDERTMRVSWNAVVKGSSRDDGLVKKISLRGSDPLYLTDEHEVYVWDSTLRRKQVRDLAVGDKMVRVAALAEDTLPSSLDRVDIIGILAKSGRKYTFRNVPLECFRVLRSRGYKIAPWWVDRRMLPLSFASEVRDGGDIEEAYPEPLVGAHRSSQAHSMFFRLGRAAGYLLGAWEANGWFRKNSVRIATGKKEVVAKIRECLHDLDLKYSEDHRDNCTVFNISSTVLRDVMIGLGFVHGAHSKTVPEFVFHTTPEFREKFVEGWIDGDAGWSVSNIMTSGMRIVAASIGKKMSKYWNGPRTTTFSDGHEARSGGSWLLVEMSGERHSVGGHEHMWKTAVTGISQHARERVYDFEVAANHNLLLGDGCVLVHNSWDLYAGFPGNLGGLELLKQMMAYGVGVDNGSIIATSKGLHIYEQYYPLVETLTRMPLNALRGDGR